MHYSNRRNRRRDDKKWCSNHQLSELNMKILKSNFRLNSITFGLILGMDTNQKISCVIVFELLYMSSRILVQFGMGLYKLNLKFNLLFLINIFFLTEAKIKFLIVETKFMHERVKPTCKCTPLSLGLFYTTKSVHQMHKL